MPLSSDPDGSRAASPTAPGLSPSRAKDFAQCPRLYRYRSVDRLPEPPSAAAVRGTLVHAVLERVFDLPASERTPQAAVALLPSAWQQLVADRPEVTVFTEVDDPEATWWAPATALVERWFTLENPQRLEPDRREAWITAELPDGPALRGIIDRVDVAPDGAVRVVDYKTGRSPRRGWEEDSWFQMRFYALALLRSTGVLPAALQLVYLGDGQVLRSTPTTGQIDAADAKIRAIWAGIQESARTGSWQPKTSRLCDWCSFTAICPAFGGADVPADPAAVERTTGIVPEG